MGLTYNGANLPSEMVDRLVKEAEKLNIPPSYLVVKLHYEGLWGKSEVARANNNWSGMTWSDSMANGRPSGVKVSRGSARPANEGGYYVRYASVDDFFKDWLYLIRRGGIYKVADSATFDEAVKGMFRCGGAKYDYATMNINGDSIAVSQQRYEAYLKGMKARRVAINNENNGYLDKLDSQKTTGGSDNMAVSAQDVLNVARGALGVTKGSSRHRQIVNEYNAVKPLPVGYAVTYQDDWCDTFVTWCAIKAGATDIIGRECGVERHKNIFKQMGIWKGVVRPQTGDIVIFRWDGNRNGWAHHIGFVESVSGNTITTIEGNTVQGGVSKVGRNKFAWNASVIQGYARPRYGASSSTTSRQIDTTGQSVTIKQSATHWQTGQRIADSVKGKKYKVAQTKNVNQSASKKAYLLTDGSVYIGWLLEQDAEGFSSTPKKTIDEVAKEVAAGKWGNGQDRTNRLKQAGYNPQEVQNKVNELLAKKSVDAIAKEVIDGKWGNNPQRIEKLKSAGYNPQEVQDAVNRLLSSNNIQQKQEVVEPSENQQVGGDKVELGENEYLDKDGVVWIFKKKQ